MRIRYKLALSFSAAAAAVGMGYAVYYTADKSFFISGLLLASFVAGVIIGLLIVGFGAFRRVRCLEEQLTETQRELDDVRARKPIFTAISMTGGLFGEGDRSLASWK